MERFVQAIAGGGLALVAGLWLATLFPGGSALWATGLALILVGLGGLGYGIWTPLDV